jgi:hypothetical protein
MKYTGGQAPILHLELDLQEVMAWADAQGRRWAFSLSNAGAAYSEFRSRADQLDQIDWPAVANTDFRSATVKEGKQAEFLVADFVPWQLVRRVGAMNPAMQAQAMRNMGGVVHRPIVEVCRSWYF